MGIKKGLLLFISIALIMIIQRSDAEKKSVLGQGTLTIPTLGSSDKQSQTTRSYLDWRTYLPIIRKTCPFIQAASVATFKETLFIITADLTTQGHPEAAHAFSSILKFYSPQELLCMATIYQAGNNIQNFANMISSALPKIPNLSQAAKAAIKKALSNAINKTLEVSGVSEL